jgi:hypothetical protein
MATEYAEAYFDECAALKAERDELKDELLALRKRENYITAERDTLNSELAAYHATLAEAYEQRDRLRAALERITTCDNIAAEIARYALYPIYESERRQDHGEPRLGLHDPSAAQE